MKMSSLTKPILVSIMLVLLTLGGLYHYGFFSEALENLDLVPKKPMSPTYPHEISLINLEGLALEVKLLARNSQYIQFERLLDGSEHLYLIESLDPASQEQVLRFPETELTLSTENLNVGKLTLNEVHVQSLRGSIKKLDDKLSFLKRSLGSGVDSARARAINHEMSEIRQEKAVLLARIAEYGIEE